MERIRSRVGQTDAVAGEARGRNDARAIVSPLQRLVDGSPQVSAQRRWAEAIADAPASQSERRRLAGMFGSTHPVQRYAVVYKPGVADKPTASQEYALKAGAFIDQCVSKAYDEFMAGDFTGASTAQQELYKLRNYEFDLARESGQRADMHPSTAAGYVIEGKATTRIMGTLPDAVAQVTDLMTGTRPDIVFKIPNTTEVGVVDITATSSAGHIFMKQGNWTGHKAIPYVAESVYPSINFASMKPLTLSAEELAAIKKRGEDKAQVAREHYDAWSNHYVREQNSVKVQLLGWFNKQNKEPFNGTARQAERLVAAFARVGIKVAVNEGKTEIALLGTIPFDEISDLKQLKPYKLDKTRSDALHDALEEASFKYLFKADL